ncbi:MAG: hypothetical protein E5V21_01815 [Mesorhizobium sp.]|nr:MAG: hypothetical protein E5V21_01815 [Mesorhizobium sp.]
MLPVLFCLVGDLLEAFFEHLVAHPAEVGELPRHVFHLGADAPRHVSQFVAGGPFDVRRIASHLVVENPERDACYRGGDRNAKVLDDGVRRPVGAKLVERHAKTGEREQEAHVIEVVTGLLVMEAQLSRQLGQAEICQH